MLKIIDRGALPRPLVTKQDMEIARKALVQDAKENNNGADGCFVSTTTGRAYYYKGDGQWD